MTLHLSKEALRAIELEAELNLQRAEVTRLTTAETECFAENAKLREGVEAIKQATIDGKVCDDIAWFSNIETLYDYCETLLDRAAADQLPLPIHKPSLDEAYERGKVAGIAVGLTRARSALDALRIPKIVAEERE